MLAAGFGVAAFIAGAVFLGPSLRDVLAEEQNQRAIYLDILNHDRGQGRVAPAVHAAAPARLTPAELSLRSLFGPTNAERGRLPAGARAYAPTPSLYPLAPSRKPSVRQALAATPRLASDFGGSGLTRRSVCVRLCDGFAFPIADYAGEADNASHSAVCAGLCPGAPTRLYVTTGASDRLTDSVSATDHRPYSALPVAFRYASSRDETCSCHAPGESLSKNVSLLRDFTLRTGDKVMTAAGFRVFQGQASWRHEARDFRPLSRTSVGSQEYRLLAAMERASKLKPQANTRFIASALTVAPAQPAPTSASSVGARVSRALGPQVFLDQNSDRQTVLP